MRQEEEDISRSADPAVCAEADQPALAQAPALQEFIRAFSGLHPANCSIAVASSAVIAFGLYNVHSFANITEGGVLGLTLLLEHWFGVSPATTNFLASVLCYALGWKLLGGRFLAYSAIGTASYSVFYAIFERFDVLWPQLANMPFAASVIGALFVGVGAGFCVRAGGAQCGDDALAMSVSHATGLGIQWVYLASDAIVLLLSLSYIPLDRIVYSLITVVISGQIIGFIQRVPFPWESPQSGGEGDDALGEGMRL